MIDWNRDPPQVPILGSNEINESPYTVPNQDTTLYKRFVRRRNAAQYWQTWRKAGGDAGLIGWLRDALWQWRQPQQPKPEEDAAAAAAITDYALEDELIEMIHADFPKRSDVIVEVMDFAPGRCELTRPRFGEVSKCKSWQDSFYIRIFSLIV